MFNYQNENSYRIATKDCQLHDREKIITELSIAETLIAFYKTGEGEFKMVQTGTGEKEFFLLCNVLNNNPEGLNLFTIVLNDIENYRKNPCPDDRYTFKALEIIHARRLYQPLNLK
jgi:hypothetical protein